MSSNFPTYGIRNGLSMHKIKSYRNIIGILADVFRSLNIFANTTISMHGTLTKYYFGFKLFVLFLFVLILKKGISKAHNKDWYSK